MRLSYSLRTEIRKLFIEKFFRNTCSLISHVHTREIIKYSKKWFIRWRDAVIGSCCFLLNYHQDQIKRKRKRTFIYCRRYVSIIENLISGYLYNKLFSENNEENCTTFQIMAWSLIFHKNTIKNCTPALQAFSFPALYLYPLFPFS